MVNDLTCLLFLASSSVPAFVCHLTPCPPSPLFILSTLLDQLPQLVGVVCDELLRRQHLEVPIHTPILLQARDGG